jgi:hypothetical protein
VCAEGEKNKHGRPRRKWTHARSTSLSGLYWRCRLFLPWVPGAGNAALAGRSMRWHSACYCLRLRCGESSLSRTIPAAAGYPSFPCRAYFDWALELAFFGFAAWALCDAGVPSFGWGLGVAVALHYVASIDRVLWLVGKR